MSQFVLLLKELAPLLPELFRLVKALRARLEEQGKEQELKAKITSMREALEKNDMADFNRHFNS